MIRKISAKIICDSIDKRNNRLTTYVLQYPRFIHGELLTHRLFSKNSASSRAIPFNKMVKMVQDDPFIPIAWQKDHKGMQGSEYLKDENIGNAISAWLTARDYAVMKAKELNEQGYVTKQLCNRLLEPFMWHEVILTATEFENFFKQRCPQYQTPVSQTIEPQRSWKDLIANHSNPENLTKLESNSDNTVFKLQHNKGQAEIHMMALAEAMWDAYNESVPKLLQEGEWHIPFGDRIDMLELAGLSKTGYKEELDMMAIKIATARCARVSYLNYEGGDDYSKDLDLYQYLVDNLHLSPLEHCARVMTTKEYYSFHKGKGANYSDDPENEADLDLIVSESDLGWCYNFKGFIQHRWEVQNA